MPKRTTAPKPSKAAKTKPSADVGTAIEVNPQFANRPGIVEVIYLPDASLTDAQAADLRASLATKQINELAELISNAQQVRASPVLADASQRIALLRTTLGL